MEILIDNRQSDVEIEEEFLEKLARHLLLLEGVDESAELSIVLLTEREVKELNSRYRGVNSATDVLSFSMLEGGGKMANPDGLLPLLLGDVVICPRLVATNAEEYGHTFKEELSLTLLHGILHLLGYEHRTKVEQRAMAERERKVLAEFLEE